jgi:hypothetical protein
MSFCVAGRMNLEPTFQMRECENCGMIRPDSQTSCDCAAAPSLRASGEKLPVCIGFSLLLGFFVELFIFYTKRELPGAELAGGAVASFMLLVVIFASFVNFTLAVMAHKRREPTGWMPAAISIAVWALTIVKVFIRP